MSIYSVNIFSVGLPVFFKRFATYGCCHPCYAFLFVFRVEEARHLPDMENWYSKIVDKKDVTDPFVDVKLDK